MYVILVYDISTEDPEDQLRLNRVYKKCKEYLNHVQKSVFEGEITRSKLYILESELLSLIDKEKDTIIIYTLSSDKVMKREILGLKEDKTSNII